MRPRERALTALCGETPDHLAAMPIVMRYSCRQIGRPYREYASDYRVLAEAQAFTAEKFGIDHVSVISDPAREAGDLGSRVEWFEDQPPGLDAAHPAIAEKADLARLAMPDPMASPRMRDRVEGVRLLCQMVGRERLVEGWVEGPMAEAADLRGLPASMLDLVDDPPFVRELFAFIVELELRFAEAQLQAGADLIGIGDAAASLIGPRLYRELVLPYERQMVDRIHALGGRVRLHICGQTQPLLADMASLGAELIDLDYPVDLRAVRPAMGDRPAILGTLDPVRVIEQGTPDDVYRAMGECHRLLGPRFVVGAGCEVTPDTPEANLMALTQYARDHRPA
jgi:MtaA/CmuA family methyltransferase